MNELLKAIISDLKISERDEKYLIIEKKEAIEPRYISLNSVRKRPIRVVDGGIGVISKTPAYCVAFYRIIVLEMGPDFSKRVERKEGFITAVLKNKKILVKQYCFDNSKASPETLLVIEPESDEPLLSAVNSGRKIMEWREAAAKETVIDGCLTPMTKEEERIKSLFRNVVGVSKSTDALGSFSGFFSKAPGGAWCAKAADGIYFAKLHGRSTHILRIDAKSHELIEKLVPWSSDSSFPGYPYPLILADHLARVTNAELSAMRARYDALGGSRQWENNVHEILDKLQF